MDKNLFSSALFAGIAAGLIFVLLQFWLVTPLLLAGEEYETGALMHFDGVVESQGDNHGHDTETTTEHSHNHADATEGDDGPQDMFARHAKTVAVTLVAYTGYGLIMVAGFAIAAGYGHTVTLHRGMVWGLLGFIALQLAPAAGLAPELPGTPAADVVSRQIWWLASVVTAVVGIAVIAFGRTPLYIVIGAALLAVPLLIGAPELSEFSGVAPPELSALFVSRTLFVAMIAWVTLGGVAGYFWHRASEST